MSGRIDHQVAARAGLLAESFQTVIPALRSGKRRVTACRRWSTIPNRAGGSVLNLAREVLERRAAPVA
jgi:hypothetical protein